MIMFDIDQNTDTVILYENHIDIIILHKTNIYNYICMKIIFWLFYIKYSRKYFYIK